MANADGWLRRNALAFWFCGLGLLGLLRAWMKLVRAPSPDVQLWLWFAGSAVLALVGIAMLRRERRRQRRINIETSTNS
ncbi:hypothetical protein [Luteimonas vadosa]|uniref:LPXTG cell wall anchor domain-containing protein n=1 Tax=Luteimonas vadosa TaxID=1165507 RepID=A0ABP9DWD6_9GAMM